MPPPRKTACPLCGTRVKTPILQAHMDGPCPKRLIECKRSCGESYSQDDMESKLKHEECECLLREVQCRWSNQGCEIPDLIAQDQKEHEDMCSYRTVTCTNTPCQIQTREVDLDEHKQLCKYRQVSCSLGCGKTLLFLEMEGHQANRCDERTVPCRWKCGAKFIAKDKAWKEHEKMQCGLRFVDCPYQCNNKIVAKNLQHHMDTWYALLFFLA